MQEEIAIQLNNVKFAYSDGDERFAVDGVDIAVKKGEFVAVLGHNGSGKSTLARLMNGLLTADEGEIFVFGKRLSDKENVYEIRKRVGMVFQNPDNQTVASIVEDDVAFGPENLGVPREEIAKRIDWALSVVGMSAYKTSTPSRLSGGQKQRVAIAGVLAVKPDVLILDEATAMLDPKGRKEVIDVIKGLNEREGITVILITHFLEEALLADRAIVMNDGKIALSGTPEEIFALGEEVEKYNLRLPRILRICKQLKSSGVPVNETLYPEVLASEVARLYVAGFRLKDKESIFKQKAPHIREGWDIEVKDLTYTYSAKSPFRTDALKGVNLTVKSGEFFGILGHTGSGKSTLVQHLNALIKLPQADKKYKPKKLKKGESPRTMPEITVGKFDLSDKKTDFNKLRANVGMVFQYPEYQLFAETVFDDVAFGLKNFYKDITQERVQEAVKESLEAVGLDYYEIKDKSPFELSGGQKRRVAIAGVIVTKPSVLILDEPAAGLDPSGKEEINALLHSLHDKWCSTVIIVSHDMDEIAENCTRAAVFYDGKRVLCDIPSNLFKDGDKLREYGLDVPLTAKICEELKRLGVGLDCDYTSDGFVNAIINLFGGGENA